MKARYRKAMIYFFAALMIVLLLSVYVFCPAQRARSEILPVQTAIFPSSLRIIENDAFAGTAFSAVFFEKGLEYIGDCAFRPSAALRNTYIPDSVSAIGENAFEVSVLIHGIEGSYSQLWANEHEYRFTVSNVWSERAALKSLLLPHELIIMLILFVPVDDGKQIVLCKRIRKVIKSMRPQDRPELYPINYRFP